jgi:hypothetical protein
MNYRFCALAWLILAVPVPLAAAENEPEINFLGVDRIEAVSFQAGGESDLVIGHLPSRSCGLRVRCARQEYEAQLALARVLKGGDSPLDVVAARVGRNVGVAEKLPGAATYGELVTVQAGTPEEPARLEQRLLREVPQQPGTPLQQDALAASTVIAANTARNDILAREHALQAANEESRRYAEKQRSIELVNQAAQACLAQQYAGARELVQQQERWSSELGASMQAALQHSRQIEAEWRAESDRHMEQAAQGYKEILAKLEHQQEAAAMFALSVATAGGSSVLPALAAAGAGEVGGKALTTAKTTKPKTTGKPNDGRNEKLFGQIGSFVGGGLGTWLGGMLGKSGADAGRAAGADAGKALGESWGRAVDKHADKLKKEYNPKSDLRFDPRSLFDGSW